MRGNRGVYNEEYLAIVDANIFPRHLWCFIENGKGYSGRNWRNSGLGELELVHTLAHKESEIGFEKPFFNDVRTDRYPHGNFSCACNVALLPKGMVRPTDNSPTIKAAFYKRYIELYGEAPLNGRGDFNKALVPDWYSELSWNDPKLPRSWGSNIDNLLLYRTQTITKLLDV